MTDLAGWYDARMTLSGGEEPVDVSVDRTMPNFFDVLGSRPILGRTFTYNHDLRQVEREVVLSYGLWRRRFGSEPHVIGKTITLDDTAFTIVGVMPANFGIRTNELPESRAELWTPFHIDPDAGVGMGGALNVVVGRGLGSSSTPQLALEGNLQTVRGTYRLTCLVHPTTMAQTLVVR